MSFFCSASLECSHCCDDVFLYYIHCSRLLSVITQTQILQIGAYRVWCTHWVSIQSVCSRHVFHIQQEYQISLGFVCSRWVTTYRYCRMSIKISNSIPFEDTVSDFASDVLQFCQRSFPRDIHICEITVKSVNAIV